MVHGQFHVCRGAFQHIDVITAGTKRLIQSTQVELSHGEGTRVKCDKTDPGEKTKRKSKNETEPEQRDAWRQIEDDNGLRRLKDVKRTLSAMMWRCRSTNAPLLQNNILLTILILQ